MKTTNQILINLPQGTVCELYCCHESLPLWSPGFIRIEHVDGPCGAVGAVYNQVYVAMGKTIEEQATLLELDVPHRIRVAAVLGDALTRESCMRFDSVSPTRTRLVVENSYRGVYVSQLVQEDQLAYTQRYLEIFKQYAERRESLVPR